MSAGERQHTPKKRTNSPVGIPVTSTFPPRRCSRKPSPTGLFTWEYLSRPRAKFEVFLTLGKMGEVAPPGNAGFQPAILDLLEKYEDAPMSVADACVVRLTEVLPEVLVLTTNADFKIYRRHSRKVSPCILPR